MHYSNLNMMSQRLWKVPGAFARGVWHDICHLRHQHHDAVVRSAVGGMRLQSHIDGQRKAVGDAVDR